MARENPALTFWDRLLPFYRRRDWEGCIRELRPVLDADEDALMPRLLCAGLHLAAGQTVLALVQYETLLPLAVGQGDFFAAIAVQKRLDQLHPAAVTHAKRYEVLRRWFTSLGRGKADPAAGRGELSENSLLALEPAEFTRVMEACALEGLEPEARSLSGDLSSIRVALYGRAFWSLRLGEEVTLLEGWAEGGQTIAVDPGVSSGARLLLTAELPTEFLVFDADAVAVQEPEASAPHAAPARAEAAPAPRAAPPLRLVEEPVDAPPPPPAESPVPAAPSAGAERAHREVPERAARPQPDPRFEPFVASFAPEARRRESRIAINVDSAIAHIGLADTRVAPIGGRLVQLAEEFAELAFAHADLRHLRTRLEGSCLGLHLNLGAATPALICTGRVRWTSALGTGVEAPELRIEIEILPVRSADRPRLAEAVLRFAARTTGEPPARAA